MILPPPNPGPCPDGSTNRVDLREALFNQRQIVRAEEIQIPPERITCLHAILVDIDPILLRPGNPLCPPADNPRDFLKGLLPILVRHPLACRAEIRRSGTGLHLIMGLDPAVELTSAAEQKSWSGVVKIVQQSLPGDLNAPGITALTRPIGSINSKNGAVVEQLRAGESNSPADVSAFVREFQGAPFRVLTSIWTGAAESVRPCPVCRSPRSSLSLGEQSGRCYKCGTVRLAQVYDAIFVDDLHHQAEAPTAGA
jgi:hypothetical protein